MKVAFLAQKHPQELDVRDVQCFVQVLTPFAFPLHDHFVSCSIRSRKIQYTWRNWILNIKLTKVKACRAIPTVFNAFTA
jgi:hypothetical protein